MMSLTSCALLRSVLQVPGRTLKTVGRTIGVGLEQCEEVPAVAPVEKAQSSQ